MAKELSGSLSKNDRKEKDNHPDVRGSCLIDGVEYWISGWSKTNDRGDWTSLAFQRKDASRPAAPKKQDSGGVDSLDSDIPF